MKNKTKYQKISDEIASGIAEGLWSDGKIPSARAIARAHDVSLVTANRSLQVLRERGIIRTIDRSGSYVASREGPSTSGERWTLCLRRTPEPWFAANLAASRSGFEAMAIRDGIRLDLETLDYRDGEPPESLRLRVRRAVDAGTTGAFLFPSRLSDAAARQDEAFLAACGEAGLPVVLIERNLRGSSRPLTRDLVAPNDFDGGFRCTEHLVALGRERIAFINCSPISSHEDRLAGYLFALHRATRGGGGRDPFVLEQASGTWSKETYRTLADDLLGRGFDAAVCYHDYTAIGLVFELMTRGVKVPDDVAITGFDGISLGDSFALGVTTYAFSAEEIARQALFIARRRISDPTGPPVKLLIPGELIVRESTTRGCP
jgi:LacI family transcriptional regulator